MFRASLAHHQRVHIFIQQLLTINQLSAFVDLNCNKSGH
jgi:hypothetical protein